MGYELGEFKVNIYVKGLGEGSKLLSNAAVTI